MAITRDDSPPAISVAFTRQEAIAELDRLCVAIRESVLGRLKRRGVVVGLSGGIDSSVVAAICARALGSESVLALLMNESESADETVRLGKLAATAIGIRYLEEPIGPILEAAGCYARRDAAIRTIVPEYGKGWRCKLVLPSIIEAERLRVFSLVVRSPQGEERTVRMPYEVYLKVVAATSFKQRVRKMLEYFHADANNYAVAGTPNRLEYDQGFFVKNGDGAADIKPIARLYKTQVYQLAELLDIPEEIRSRPPTTDTYSLPQSQEEFYFSLPYAEMDLCLYGRDNDIPPARIAATLGLETEQVSRVYRDIDAKRSAARYLHAAPILLDAQPATHPRRDR